MRDHIILATATAEGSAMARSGESDRAFALRIVRVPTAICLCAGVLVLMAFAGDGGAIHAARRPAATSVAQADTCAVQPFAVARK